MEKLQCLIDNVSYAYVVSIHKFLLLFKDQNFISHICNLFIHFNINISHKFYEWILKSTTYFTTVVFISFCFVFYFSFWINWCFKDSYLIRSHHSMTSLNVAICRDLLVHVNYIKNTSINFSIVNGYFQILPKSM